MDMDKEVLDILVEVLLEEGLNDILMQDQNYVKLEEQINEQGEKFEGMAMDAEQRTAAEKLISLHIASTDYYVKYAYKQGFKDCLSLFQELGLIKIGDIAIMQKQVMDKLGG